MTELSEEEVLKPIAQSHPETRTIVGAFLGRALLMVAFLVWTASSAWAASGTVSSFSPAASAFGSGGGSGLIQVTAAGSWTAESSDTWISITSGTSFTGSGSASFSVAPNVTGFDRTGGILLGDQIFLVRQAKSDFSDNTDLSSWSNESVNAIYVAGITVGCGNNRFCKGDPVTREQMAAFIVRAVAGEEFIYTRQPYFVDVPSSAWSFKYVQKLKDLGLTANTGSYDPAGTVTREQMAAFLMRAKYGENFVYPTAPYFSDVAPTAWSFKYVQKLKEQGYTYATERYGAADPVTREQMAAFLSRVFIGMTATYLPAPPDASTSFAGRYQGAGIAPLAAGTTPIANLAFAVNEAGTVTGRLVDKSDNSREYLFGGNANPGTGTMLFTVTTNHGSRITATGTPSSGTWTETPSDARPAAGGVYTALKEGAAAYAARYVKAVQNQFHSSLQVYSDDYAAGNHFAARGRMYAVAAMQEEWQGAPHSGSTAIRCQFDPSAGAGGGWYFLNGVLDGSETRPRENWGDIPDAGIDLSGATQLTFWAKGDQGGETVEFFALGAGRNNDTGAAEMPYPDSSPKVRTTVTLSNEWREYTIPLSGHDLSYVLGGFGWFVTAEKNAYRNVVFYLDDIYYDRPALAAPRFLVSYQTQPGSNSFDAVMRNVAFTYDNAVALISLLGAGDHTGAKLIADAFVYAQNHDRYYSDGRLRNAYQGGDLILPPGWTPNGRIATVRMPGWSAAVAGSDTRSWLEDAYQVGTDTGNMAWAMLALLAYYEVSSDTTYLSAASRLGEWIEENCRDLRGAGGYTGGYYEWEPTPAKRTYKSTEHNIDLTAAFARLYVMTGDSKWRERSLAAKQFVLAMWDGTPGEGKFWTGTGDDGATVNKTPHQMPLDVQAWTMLSLGDEAVPYRGALSYAEKHMALYSPDNLVPLGFDFNDDRDGVWYEGTAQMAEAFRNAARPDKADTYRAVLEAAQLPSGALPAASKETITTGFQLPGGSDWLYYRRQHVGATAWFLLAAQRMNPFWPFAPR